MAAPLTSAAVVCRAQPRLAPLKHVTAAVSSFLDFSAQWTIASACRSDTVSLRLLNRIAAHRAADAAADCRSLRAQRQRDGFYRQWEFTRAAAAAARRGDLTALKWLVDMFPACRVTATVEEAAKHGQLQVLEWLLTKSRRRELTVFWGARELFFAGKHGHLHVAQWLHDHTAPPPTHMFFVTLEEAARNGDLDMVTWLCERVEGCSAKAFVNATAAGELEILMWLFTNHREQLGRDRLRIYALGKFYILHWLKVEAGADEREAFMGEANPLAQG
ncbi:Secreted RxLR effector protein 124 [Phytophthora ramorum]|uniref:Secreted RxLR effector protein 124 n=1 Tax=Phytophthora ramorum TaxID=164328 RepID=UPI0030950D89|nr:Secreted RxLR effector protein 124 [Phytophthora ramorum]